MSSLDIKINISKLTDYSDSLDKDIDKRTLMLIMESFSKYISIFYIRLIIEAINSNRYKGNWEPVDDEGYREYLGVEPVGDIVSLIREALEVKKIGYNFVIRIEPSYRYPGSDIPLERVLRAIDSGTSKFHSRPIFSRIRRDINSNLISLWRGYLKMKGVI